MTTFYDILEIQYNDDNTAIINAYKNKIKNFKYKQLDINDILLIKQYKTALYILTNFELRNKYNNLIYSNDNIIETNNNIIEANNDNDVSLDSLFNNILDNNDNTINIPNSKSKSLEQMNNYMSNRIFDTINKKPNNIIINNLIPIQTREDRKLVN